MKGMTFQESMKDPVKGGELKKRQFTGKYQKAPNLETEEQDTDKKSSH